MPMNNFNVGSDVRLVILHPFAPGGRLDLSDVTDFKADQQTKALNYTTIAGQTKKGEYPTGWTLTIGMERASAAADDFVAALEQAILNGQNVPAGTVYQYVTEVDGSTSTYQFQGVAFKFSDAGNYAGAETVKQSLMGEAERRVRV